MVEKKLRRHVVEVDKIKKKMRTPLQVLVVPKSSLHFPLHEAIETQINMYLGVGGGHQLLLDDQQTLTSTFLMPKGNSHGNCNKYVTTR